MTELLALLLLWLQVSLPQEHWVLVYRGGGLETVAGAPRLTGEQRARLAHAWSWSGRSAPRRVEPDRLGERLPETAARLRVRGGRPGLRLVAAPVAMWRDVPEDLLPSWPVPAGGTLDLPVSSERWRLRLVGKGEGSWWVDVPAGARSAHLSPAPARDVELRVAAADGAVLGEVAGHLARGAESRDPAPWARYRAGQGAERGRLVIPSLPDQEEVSLTVVEIEHAPAVLRGLPGELPAEVRLAPGASLAGRLTDAAGRPVPGAQVRLETWVSTDLPRSYLRGAESGADGSWTIRGLPAGPAALLARAPGFAPHRARLDLAAGRQDLGAIVLQAGATLKVQAVDDRGEPVPGARIDAGPGLAATTDARGVASLTGAPAGEPLELTARADRHLPGKARVSPPFAALQRIELPRAFTVQGRFVDPGGAPVLDGTLVVLRGTSSRDEPLGDGGRFELSLAPSQTAGELLLSSPATRELRVALPSGAPGEVLDLGDLQAPPGAVVTGRVVRAADGSAVAGARVWLPRPSADGPLLAWASGDLLEARSDERGAFRLAGLAPGPALLRVDAAGLARAHLEISLGSEPVDLGEVRLADGVTLSVRAEGSEDGALARVDLRGDWLELDMRSAPLRDGRADFHHLPPGRVTVSVVAGRRLLCEREVVLEGTRAEVDCAADPLTVEGVVTAGGIPDGPGTLIWLPPAAATPGEVQTTVSPSGLRQQRMLGGGRPQVDVPVAADGSFRTGDLTPGSWRVAWHPSLGSPSAPQAVEIPRGERYETRLDFPGFGVEGLVTDEDRPVEGARVREIATGALAVTGADGRFRLTGLEAGLVRLQARQDERASAVLELRLETGRRRDPVHLPLREPADPELRVAVLSADGAPVPGALVFLQEEGRGERILTTGADGRAALRVEPPFPPRLRLAATSGNLWALGSWTGWEEAAEGLTLRLSGAAGTLRAVSESARGALRIVAQDGWDLSWLLTRLGGRPELSPDLPWRLDGLPAGTYTVTLGEASRTVRVQDGEAAEASFE